MKVRTTTNIISSLLIFLFSYTALSKFISLPSFRAVLGQVFNKKGAALIALLIPTMEAFIVLLLIVSKTRLIGLYASAVLLCAFTVYLAYMILFIPHLPCSCGGVIGKMSWKEHVAFNLFFIVLTVTSIRNYKRGPNL